MQKFLKTNVYGGAWSKTRFADACIVEGQYKIIYIAGMGSEDAATGKIEHLGDFMSQCQMAYNKIQTILNTQGGDMSNIVRIVAYLTDMRYSNDYITCRDLALAGAQLPPHTLINVNQLAWPGMMVEVEVTAAVPI